MDKENKMRQLATLYQRDFLDLRENEDVMGLINAIIDDLQHGPVVLVGPSGSGKTGIALTVVKELSERGVPVVYDLEDEGVYVLDNANPSDYKKIIEIMRRNKPALVTVRSDLLAELYRGVKDNSIRDKVDIIKRFKASLVPLGSSLAEIDNYGVKAYRGLVEYSRSLLKSWTNADYVMLDELIDLSTVRYVALGHRSSTPSLQYLKLASREALQIGLERFVRRAPKELYHLETIEFLQYLGFDDLTFISPPGEVKEKVLQCRVDPDCDYDELMTKVIAYVVKRSYMATLGRPFSAREFSALSEAVRSRYGIDPLPTSLLFNYYGEYKGYDNWYAFTHDSYSILFSMWHGDEHVKSKLQNPYFLELFEALGIGGFRRVRAFITREMAEISWIIDVDEEHLREARWEFTALMRDVAGVIEKRELENCCWNDVFKRLLKWLIMSVSKRPAKPKRRLRKLLKRALVGLVIPLVGPIVTAGTSSIEERAMTVLMNAYSSLANYFDEVRGSPVLRILMTIPRDMPTLAPTFGEIVEELLDEGYEIPPELIGVYYAQGIIDLDFVLSKYLKAKDVTQALLSGDVRKVLALFGAAIMFQEAERRDVLNELLESVRNSPIYKVLREPTPEELEGCHACIAPLLKALLLNYPFGPKGRLRSAALSALRRMIYEMMEGGAKRSHTTALLIASILNPEMVVEALVEDEYERSTLHKLIMELERNEWIAEPLKAIITRAPHLLPSQFVKELVDVMLTSGDASASGAIAELLLDLYVIKRPEILLMKFDGKSLIWHILDGIVRGEGIGMHPIRNATRSVTPKNVAEMEDVMIQILREMIEYAKEVDESAMAPVMEVGMKLSVYYPAKVSELASEVPPAWRRYFTSFVENPCSEPLPTLGGSDGP